MSLHWRQPNAPACSGSKHALAKARALPAVSRPSAGGTPTGIVPGLKDPKIYAPVY